MVGICLVGSNPLVSDILEGVIHKSPIAPVVSILPRTVKQILNRKDFGRAFLDKFHTFESIRGWESPARTTLPLVDDGSDFSSCSPVHVDVERGGERV